ncbi:UDP-glucose 4-epimerase GalE [Bradyrhizobium diazoefficiens]|nr:UDP-glucose 4-epimerase GalE [Bradyrhizobium diazoefficiens]QQN61946.1 UDP-glucose 4-epimerase GalE [Bradyrhizobium diazoefficiens]
MMILVTGGAGYIGSHTCVELLKAGHDVIVVDNLSNSSQVSLRRVEQICGRSLLFREGDIRDRALLKDLMLAHEVSAVIHFAGLKAVGESVQEPVAYYDNNVSGTLQLLAAMQEAGVKKIVFSSSATVYGEPNKLPLGENHPLSATNPYGRSKLMIEEVLRDQFVATPDWSIAILRYFNPVGAHESGLIGESPLGVPNNLLPYVAQVAVGRRKYLNVWGKDYATPDGTGVRDYIHVVDLAVGHLMALNKMQHPQVMTVNLGTGTGTSVLEIVEAFSKASGRNIPVVFGPRRPGDVASCYADATVAEWLLGWKAKRSIMQMCIDHWRWQESNLDGYGAEAR